MLAHSGTTTIDQPRQRAQKTCWLMQQIEVNTQAHCRTQPYVWLWRKKMPLHFFLLPLPDSVNQVAQLYTASFLLQRNFVVAIFAHRISPTRLSKVFYFIFSLFFSFLNLGRCEKGGTYVVNLCTLASLQHFAFAPNLLFFTQPLLHYTTTTHTNTVSALCQMLAYFSYLPFSSHHSHICTVLQVNSFLLCRRKIYI